MLGPNVIEWLENGPKLIAERGEKVAQCRKTLDEAKRNLDLARAAATILHGNAKNQKILEANVLKDPEVDRRDADLTTAQANLKVAENDMQEVENAFISARRLSGIQNTVSEIPLRSPLPLDEDQPAPIDA